MRPKFVEVCLEKEKKILLSRVDGGMQGLT